MLKQRYATELIIHMLREADLLTGQSLTVAQATKQIGVTDETYFRWPRPMVVIGRIARSVFRTRRPIRRGGADGRQGHPAGSHAGQW